MAFFESDSIGRAVRASIEQGALAALVECVDLGLKSGGMCVDVFSSIFLLSSCQ